VVDDNTYQATLKRVRAKFPDRTDDEIRDVAARTMGYLSTASAGQDEVFNGLMVLLLPGVRPTAWASSGR
jgi:hypothetical protein